jgi:hypothetical protein
MGSRFEKGLETYFRNLDKVYRSLATLCGHETVVVQVVAFSKPEWQIERFLNSLSAAGFKESSYSHSRPIRLVPNRKWYTNLNKGSSSGLEHMFVHKLA